tara:strand:- start:147 stop:827 length:681 start_codon:yes stop_codon:yes gene_type:complete
MNSLGVVLFMGRNSCPYSNRIKKLLEKSSKKFYYFESKRIGEKINKKYLKLNYDYIFCFRSYYILKNNILKKVKNAAINFHPGPPEYRGTGCINYALYENSRFYGCTAHLISEKVDNGKIIGIKKFNISKKNSVTEVLIKTYETMTNLAISTIKDIKKYPDFIENQILKNKNIRWSKKIKTLKDLNNFYQIDKNIKKNDLLNKIRATDTPKFKPYLKLHGKKFILE